MNATLPKDFNELITESKLPVLVDFWADWCGPCKMVSPTIDKIAKEYKGKILTVKVNIDNKQHVAAQFGVQSIPTIMLFYKGQTLVRLSGAHPYETIKEEIDRKLPLG